MKLPYMKLWIGDYLADTQHFDDACHGAYIQLILHCWRNGGMVRVEELRIVAHSPPRRWARIKPRLERAFDVQSIDGFWLHSRVMSELRSANEKSEKSKAAAMRMHSKRRANANANASQTHTQLQSELVRTKTVTREPPAAVARNGGSGGGGSLLSQAEQDRLIAAYERQTGKPWDETAHLQQGMSPERPPRQR